jgi:hypothetical protein
VGSTVTKLKQPPNKGAVMTAWDNSQNNNIVTRDQARTKIMEKAREEGYDGAFKVFYEGKMIADPANLPEQVDMSKITVSEVLDQA